METQYLRSEDRGHKLIAEFEVPNPKVKIKNNIFPFPDEYYNCETCRRARLLERPEPGVIRVKCLLSGLWIEENKDIFDNGCSGHARKTPRTNI